MKAATIVPISQLHQIALDDYHMALAHLVKSDHTYEEFYRHQAQMNKFVLMDNGVVETGQALDKYDLMELATLIRPSEIVLPDIPNDMQRTLELSRDALEFFRSPLEFSALMVVPQGRTRDEWIACVREMLTWDGVDTFGISRFVHEFYPKRADALADVPNLLDSKKHIHLLGCPDDPAEIAEVEWRYPGRVRGVDSGIAAIYSQVGRRMSTLTAKPNVELDFRASANASLLRENIKWWLWRSQVEIRCPRCLRLGVMATPNRVSHSDLVPHRMWSPDPTCLV